MKRIAVLLCLVGLTAAVFAKEKPSIALEVGAVGNENTNGQKIFNPDIHLNLAVPLFDIRENLMFALTFGYDFAWETYDYESNNYTNSSDTRYSHTKTSSYMHLLSLFPVLAIKKNNVTICAGTGVSFAVKTYDYTYDTSSSQIKQTTYTTTESETMFHLFWHATVGIQYRLTEHFAFTGDVSMLVSLLAIQPGQLNERTDYQAEYVISGSYPLHISPKIGVCYTF